jgi:chromosome segregation ATPase
MNGICRECEHIILLEEQEAQIKKEIENLNNELNDKDKLYQSICEKAKEDALKNVTVEINQKNGELAECIKLIDSSHQELEGLKSETEKYQKSLNSNISKLQKIQTAYKGMKYAIDNFFRIDVLDKDIIEELNSRSDELLSTTVELKLHLMDVKQLRKLYNQNYKIIQDTLQKYQERYTTKTNMAIYKLMIIALEAELQNVLYNIKFGKLDNAINDEQKATLSDKGLIKTI